MISLAPGREAMEEIRSLSLLDLYIQCILLGLEPGEALLLRGHIQTLKHRRPVHRHQHDQRRNSESTEKYNNQNPKTHR